MGITISNHKRSINMGSGGYLRLRVTVSKLLNCQEFADIYSEFLNPWQECKNRGFETMQEYYEDHDKRAMEVCERYLPDEEVVNWLYSSDCGCSVSAKTCRHLWKIVKDYDDDVVYGYPGQKNPAMFKDFKEIVRECAEDRRVMKIG